MNFQQLRIIRETVRQNFNLTEVAEALFTSQPGVSKHIMDLEEELGFELFIRKGKRLMGLTEPGKELLTFVERILLDAQNIKQLANQFTKKDEGQLIVATTHTQARYILPRLVKAFRDSFPKVHLVIKQGSPDEIVTLLQSGAADIGIATESLAGPDQLATFPYYQWHHGVIVPKGHPLEKSAKLSLQELVNYPIITYHAGFTGRRHIDQAFFDAGLQPDIVLSALDADVIKAYVELGIGIGIVASMAYAETRDQSLSLLNTDHLFRRNTTVIGIRKGRYLRGFAYKFIELCSPALTEAMIKDASALPG